MINRDQQTEAEVVFKRFSVMVPLKEPEVF